MKKILYNLLLVLAFALPCKAQNTATNTEINVGVNEMGTATANVPIDCPTGRNGVKPNLSISFNSNIQTGILGKGFALNGISSISRGGNNFHTDKRVQSGITHTGKDKFFLDGNKLVLTGGSYGMAGSTYRTENDLFVNITYTASGFWAVTKEGGLLKYTVPFSLNNITTPLAYYLADSYDKWGNFIHYTYDNLNGEITLMEIVYNGFDGSLGGYRTTTTPAITANLIIGFNYTNIDTKLDKFIDGGTKLSNRRLETIEIKNGTTILNTYSFAYSSTNKNGKLNSIAQTNKAAVEFTWGGNATDQRVSGQVYTQMDNYKTVGDFNGDGKTDLLTVNGVLNLIDLHPFDPGDPNNVWFYQFNQLLGKDNFLSILTTGSNNKMTTPPLIIKQLPFDSIANISIVDFDADGKDDIIFQMANITLTSTGYSAYYRYRIFKMELNEQLQIVNLIPFKTKLPSFSFSYTALPEDIFRANLVTPYFIDMDGDGLPDLAQKTTDVLTNNTQLHFYFSTDNYDTLRTLGIGYSLNDLNAFLPVDFDGNGKKDIFISSDAGFYLNVKNGILTYDLSTKTFIAPTDLIDLTQSATLSNFRTGDFNGDGNSDIIYNSLAYYGIRQKIAYSNGKDKYLDDFVKKQGFFYSYGNNGSSIGTQLEIADFNGDGMDDILERYDHSGANTCQVYFSTGYDDFVEGPITSNRNVVQNPSRFGNYLLGDYNADGKKDVFMLESEPKVNGFSNYVIEYHKSNTLELQQIIQPKKMYEFTYAALTQYSGYKHTWKPAVVNNCVGINIPIKVVSSLAITTTNSLDEYYTYHYKDLIYNRHGRGLMGFMEMLKTSLKGSSNNNTQVQVNHYQQGHALAHQLNLKKVLNYNSAAIDNATNTVFPSNLVAESNYEYRTIGTSALDGINFTFLSISAETNYVTQNVKKICYDYDMNGNLILNSALYNILGKPDILYSNATNYTYDQFDTWLPSTLTRSDNYKKRKNQPTKHTPIVYAYQPSTSILKTITQYKLDEYFEYDTYGNRIRKGYNYPQNPAGGYIRNTYIHYDAAHHFIDHTLNDAGHKTEYVYDPNKQLLLTETAPNGLATNYEYDTWGRLTKTTQANGNYTATNYDVANNNDNYKIEEYNNLGNRATKTYNWKMMLLTEEKTTQYNSSAPNKMATKTYTYNEDELLVAETNWYDADAAAPLITDYEYDSYNRPTIVKLNNEKIKQYDYGDHEVTYTEGVCAPKKTTLDVLNMAESIEEAGNEIAYTYNSSNLPIAINTNNNTITYEYSDNGTLTKQCDPNSGCTTLEYNPLNELVKSTDAKSNIYNFTYDNLGKLLQKTAMNNTVYTYEYYDNNLQPNLNLPKTQTLTENGTIKNKIEYTYNSLAELSQTDELAANGITYTTTYQYNNISGKHRLHSINYPNIAVTYQYDNNNNLQAIQSGSQPFIWKNELEAIDGRPLLTSYGNDFITQYTYDANLNLASIKSSHINMPNNIVMNAAYTFDLVSKNLTRKDDIKYGSYETFEYDNLDRLTKTTTYLPTQAPVSYEINYDKGGNITSKYDAGTFDNTGTKPHAVQSNTFENSLSPVIIPNTFAEQQNITYTQSNKPATLLQGSKNLSISYGFNEQRIHTLIQEYSVTTTEIYYIGSANMEIVNGAEITYLQARGQAFAYHKKSGSNESINYLHLDYQGSIMAISNPNGTLKEERNYDAWGRARNPQKLYYTTLNPFGSGGDIRRGYTMHEHLEEFNLINMNGRVYDPLLARFLNADPLLQDNTDAQNYNRYSYVLNNPTKYTDPSGYAYSNYDNIQGAITTEREEMNRNLGMEAYANFQGLRDMDMFNRGGSLGGDASTSGIPDDGEPYKISDKERAELSKYGGKVPEYGIRITPRSGIDLGKVNEFCGNSRAQSGGGELEDMRKNPPNHPEYESPKGGDRKVKNPNGLGSGWIDNKGRVWVPSDNKGNHAPHWDRQKPGGGYDNVYPLIRLTFEPSMREEIGRKVGLSGTALTIYLIISEGSRLLFPPRNLVPIP